MTCAQVRLSLGVYVLGSLPDDERRQVADHLRDCGQCRAEHAALARLPALMALLSADEVAAAGTSDGTTDGASAGASAGTSAGTDEGAATGQRPALVAGPAGLSAGRRHRGPEPPQAKEASGPVPIPDLERRLRAAVAAERADSRRRRWRIAGGLAAAGLTGLLAGVVVTSVVDGGSPSGSGAAGTSRQTVSTSASDPASGVAGRVTMSSRAWGTALAVTVTDVPANTECSLVVTGADGRQDVAAGWKAVYERPANVQGATAFQMSDIAKLDLRTAGGRTLVTWRPPGGG